MADLNRTTAERLAERPRHLRIWRFARPLATLWARRTVNLTWDDLSDIPAPYLLLCNHTTNPDPIFVGLAMGRQAYFVATENLLHKGWVSKLLMWSFCPIIHQKGRMGLRSAKEIQQTLKAGASVVLFPEGSRTFNGLTLPIPPVTAKLARKAGRVVCVRMEGGYLSQPRWATTMRKGRLHMRRAAVLEADDMAKMSDAELQAAIEAALLEDAYARQAQIAAEEGAAVAYRGKHPALGMESTLFVCPSCEGLGTLRSDDESIRCTAPDCTFAARYLPTGYLAALESGADLRFSSITEWDLWQQQRLKERFAQARARMDAWVASAAGAAAIAATLSAETNGEPVEGMPAPPAPELLFADDVTVELYSEAHELLRAMPGRLELFAGSADPCNASGAAGFAVFTQSDGTTHTVTPDDVEGVALFTRNTLIVHIGKPAQHCEVQGDMRFNALQYAYACEELRTQG